MGGEVRATHRVHAPIVFIYELNSVFHASDRYMLPDNRYILSARSLLPWLGQSLLVLHSSRYSYDRYTSSMWQFELTPKVYTRSYRTLSASKVRPASVFNTILCQLGLRLLIRMIGSSYLQPRQHLCWAVRAKRSGKLAEPATARLKSKVQEHAACGRS